MRNSSFFEKLTGSLRLSDDDLKALNEPEENTKGTTRKVAATAPAVKKPNADYDEIIEEVDDDFEIPDDAEIETIEEVIEDDSIDHEQVEEYYEEIIDEEEDEPDNVEISEAAPEETVEEVAPEEETVQDNYPVFKFSDNYKEEPEEEKKVLNVKPLTNPQLPIDVFEMHHEVVLRILVPGITPENLKVSITRDHVSLTCSRPAPEGIPDSSYYEREIPYGDFTRMIHLPSDVDVEHAEAVEKYGLLIIRLPKLDAKKVQELKIRSV